MELSTIVHSMYSIHSTEGMKVQSTLCILTRWCTYCVRVLWQDNQDVGCSDRAAGWRGAERAWRFSILCCILTRWHTDCVRFLWQDNQGVVTILLLTFPHSFSSYTLCMLLPHAYYFLFTFLFSSIDFLFLHVQPYCLCIASCTVRLLMHSPAQSAY